MWTHTYTNTQCVSCVQKSDWLLKTKPPGSRAGFPCDLTSWLICVTRVTWPTLTQTHIFFWAHVVKQTHTYTACLHEGKGNNFKSTVLFIFNRFEWNHWLKISSYKYMYNYCHRPDVCLSVLFETWTKQFCLNHSWKVNNQPPEILLKMAFHRCFPDRNLAQI